MTHRYSYLLADYQAFLPAELSIFDTNVPVLVPDTPMHRSLCSLAATKINNHRSINSDRYL